MVVAYQQSLLSGGGILLLIHWILQVFKGTMYVNKIEIDCEKRVKGYTYIVCRWYSFIMSYSWLSAIKLMQSNACNSSFWHTLKYQFIYVSLCFALQLATVTPSSQRANVTPQAGVNVNLSTPAATANGMLMRIKWFNMYTGFKCKPCKNSVRKTNFEPLPWF